MSSAENTKLKALLEIKKMSQAQLGRITGMALSTINEIVNGKIQMTIATLFKLCKALDVTPNDILEYPGEKRKPFKKKYTIPKDEDDEPITQLK